MLPTPRRRNRPQKEEGLLRHRLPHPLSNLSRSRRGSGAHRNPTPGCPRPTPTTCASLHCQNNKIPNRRPCCSRRPSLPRWPLCSLPPRSLSRKYRLSAVGMARSKCEASCQAKNWCRCRTENFKSSPIPMCPQEQRYRHRSSKSRLWLSNCLLVRQCHQATPPSSRAARLTLYQSQ